MPLKTIRLSDRAQDVFIDAREVDAQTIRLDISDAYNDSSTELTVDRAKLLEWCRAVVNSFDNGASSGRDTSSDTN